MGILESSSISNTETSINHYCSPHIGKVIDRLEVDKQNIVKIEQNIEYTKYRIMSSLIGNNQDSNPIISIITTQKSKKEPSVVVVKKGSSGVSSLQHRSNSSGFDDYELPSDIAPMTQTILKPIKIVTPKVIQSSICQTQSIEMYESVKVLGQNN